MRSSPENETPKMNFRAGIGNLLKQVQSFAINVF